MARILVIMPLRADANVEEKRKVIIESLGDEVILPDVWISDLQPDFDIVQAIDSLSSADLVIADLSFERPSCYFELGMAQAMGVRSFLIAENGTKLHQHSGSVRFYTGLEEFRRLIKSAVSVCIGGGAGSKQHNNRLQATRFPRA